MLRSMYKVNGALVRTITTNKTINDSKNVTRLEKVTPNGYMYLGTYTFLIIDAFLIMEVIDALWRDKQVGSNQPQVVTRARAEHHAVFAQADGRPVTVDGGVVNRKKRHQPAVSGISSVQTLKLSNRLGPNVVAIATSDASRPRAISTRLLRGVLLRGSKMCQRPPIQASNHAAKSPGGKGGGVPTSPR